jgi:SpoVK/Ycf46/Vps4 family AAA+-type ATPase
LFGKRSEVRDSHDRYANVETSYLLQRIDAYEGMVILATNFSRNLDEAFLRRFQFIVELTAPAEPERRRIWEGIWPRDVPRAPDIDLDFMAKRFELSGGHIRNIAVAAAFLAAAEDARVSQRHLLHATKREYQKLGRRVDDALFRR